MIGSVQGVGSSTPATAQNTSAAESTGGDFEMFLKMLTTQIRNQDPLNPMESSDFAVQLATFSGVEQQVRTNALLAAMAGEGGGGIGTYASWIGREVRSQSAAWFGDDPITLEVDPDPAADTVVLAVSDATGRVVAREDIGAGSGTLEWFGRDETGTRLAPGQYSFAVESWLDGKLLGRQAAETYTQVVAVESGPSGVELVLNGGGRVDAANTTGLRDRPVGGPAS